MVARAADVAGQGKGLPVVIVPLLLYIADKGQHEVEQHLIRIRNQQRAARIELQFCQLRDYIFMQFAHRVLLSQPIGHCSVLVSATAS